MKHITHTSIEKAIGIIDNLDDKVNDDVKRIYSWEELYEEIQKLVH